MNLSYLKNVIQSKNYAQGSQGRSSPSSFTNTTNTLSWLRMVFHTDRNTLENFNGHKPSNLSTAWEDHPGIANAILFKYLHHGYLRRGPGDWVFHTNRVQPPIQSPINISKYLDLANETSVHANIKIYNRWGCTRWGGVRPPPGSSRLLSSRCRWPLLAIFCLLPCPLLFPFSDPDCSMTSISSLPRNISKLQFAVLAITK